MPVRMFLSRIHAKLGDLWWYTILLFVAQRFGDVINMFVGLWIVPKYVPMEELGAVLPLTQVVGLIGVPLTIISIPFLKFIAVFAEKKEFGKAKALIRDTFVGTGVFAVLSIQIAYFILPFFFERLRIQSGSLAFLLVVITVLTAVSTIFFNAVSGLKLFGATIWFNVATAPLRLILMLVFMPFRALSGYVLGQAANPGVTIVGSFVVLRKFFRTAGPCVSYWREYGFAIWRYTWPLAVMTIIGAVTGNMDMLVIRHRLCEFESAGYYMITRFSDIALQLGSVFAAFLLPMLAGKDGNDGESRRLAFHSIMGVTVAGLLLSAALAAVGRPLLSLKPEWAPYAPLTPHMVALAVNGTIGMVCLCLTTTLTARSQFGFLWYCMPLSVIKSVVLYALTGYTFFSGFVPSAWINAVANFNPCRLSVVLWVMIAGNVASLVVLWRALVKDSRRELVRP